MSLLLTSDGGKGCAFPFPELETPLREIETHRAHREMSSHLRRVGIVQGAISRAHGILQQVPEGLQPEEASDGQAASR